MFGQTDKIALIACLKIERIRHLSDLWGLLGSSGGKFREIAGKLFPKNWGRTALDLVPTFCAGCFRGMFSKSKVSTFSSFAAPCSGMHQPVVEKIYLTLVLLGHASMHSH